MTPVECMSKFSMGSKKLKFDDITSMIQNNRPMVNVNASHSATALSDSYVSLLLSSLSRASTEAL